MSNKNEPHKKYVQTFVLAKQANGYYVLNDIFRYIAEEEDDDIAEAPEPEPVALPASEPEIKTLPSTNDVTEQATGADVVDQELEQSTGSLAPARTPTPSTLAAAAPEPSAEPAQELHEETKQAAEAPAVEPEDPKDPEPSPAPPTPQPKESTPAPAKEPAAASKPSAPKTWASMFSGGKVATPVVPAVPSTTAPPAKKAAPAAPVAPAAATPASAATPPTDDSQPLPSPGGWQTAGQEHKSKVTRAQSTSVSVPNGREGFIKAYIKNVTSKVDEAVLRSTLSKYGKLEYFDVSRPKVSLFPVASTSLANDVQNCAFVEFADQAAFNAAVAANPHNINGEDVFVEERHIRSGSTYGGFSSRGSMRGRGTFPKEGGRGTFSPRGGRGGSISRGRGMPQAA